MPIQSTDSTHVAYRGVFNFAQDDDDDGDGSACCFIMDVVPVKMEIDNSDDDPPYFGRR